MVVEDFDDTRRMIALELRNEGYEVVEVSDGRVAVEAVRRRCPDLVLLELSLPGCDGLTAAFRMREVAAMCHVPIVACTTRPSSPSGTNDQAPRRTRTSGAGQLRHATIRGQFGRRSGRLRKAADRTT